MKINYFISQKLGINKPILFSLLSTVIQLFGSFFTLLLIAVHLSQNEQGYYYTFLSLASVQIFFELGFTGVITQFVAHEFSSLEIKSKLKIEGNEKALSRLASLFKFAIEWFLKFSIFLFITLILVGFYFFNIKTKTFVYVNWEIPWILLSLGTSINLISSFFVSFVLGLNEVKFISKIQVIANLLKISILCIGIYLGLKLFVLGVASIIYAIIILLLIWNRFKNIFFQFFKQKITNKISFWNEIFPYQWKISISWVSGFFIFQLFNPLAFVYASPDIAGKLGMTMVLVNTTSSIALIWTNTKVPYYAMQIANKNFNETNIIFDKTLRQSVFIAILFILLLFLFIYSSQIKLLPNIFCRISDRLLGFENILFLCSTVILNIFTSSWAIYLRCFKREPFLLHAIITAILCLISFTHFGSKFGVKGIIISYFFITLLMFPFSYLTFKISKRNWQSN